MFIGSAGTGKTAVIRDYLYSTNSDKIVHRTINFNSFTDSLALQNNIESLVEKKSGKTYGSATNKILLYFIDDMNMPFVDKYGTQSPIALLRQILDYGSCFNREMLEERKMLQDLLFVACQNPKSGSFFVNLRLQRHFSVFSMYTPSSDTIKTVYGSILGGHLQYFDEKLGSMSEKIVEATLTLFNRILKDTRYSPSARKFHYQFNLRELSHVIEGVMLATPNAYKGHPKKLTKLWLHEAKRVFEDRMINDEDAQVFRGYLRDACVKCISGPGELGDQPEVVASLCGVNGSNPEYQESLIFTNFISVHNG